MTVGVESALWACALMTVASMQIEYAQEARAYAMLIALSLWAAVSVLHVQKQPSIAWTISLILAAVSCC